MPFNELLSFLRSMESSMWWFQKGVNALIWAFFISTKKSSDNYFCNIVCQCPYTGLLHFYGGTRYSQSDLTVYQCPLTGLLHFYSVWWKFIGYDWWYQCPLTGLLHFYDISTADMEKLLVYQCPLTGFLHFYEFSDLQRNWYVLYQCPLTGLLHFYSPLLKILSLDMTCINAL